jgi:hypothetical protein
MSGMMAGGIKDITKMIRSMAMENMFGQMEKLIEVGGIWVNSMDLEFSKTKVENKRLVYGSKEKNDHGLIQVS